MSPGGSGGGTVTKKTKHAILPLPPDMAEENAVIVDWEVRFNHEYNKDNHE